jgi:ATP-dependent exoDNAse (exonuclease V) alpha subunit
VLARRWRDVEPISDKIRQIHIDEGQVCKEGEFFNCIVGDRQMRLQMAVGDRVRFTKNDYATGFTNGQTGKITRIQRDAEAGWQIKMVDDDGRLHHISESRYSDENGRLHLVHAYASTIYAAQGLTVDRTLVLHDPQMDRASAYVAGSRHRDSCEWFLNRALLDEVGERGQSDDDRVQLAAESISRDKYQETAIELWRKLPKLEVSDGRKHEVELQCS